MRKGRGVYYTPPPVVNFIVRAIDDLLKDSFGIRDGLADHHRVTVLDFACGTGTFLLEVCQRVFENVGGPDSSRADLIVRDHILKNLFGFEFLIAPYTIAHLKLSQYLQDQDHKLQDNERLQVFLTNTLEPIEPQPNFLLPAVSAEVRAAQDVKDSPILVITGNPPYAARSKNKGPWIRSRVKAYEFIDGQHLGERKHWLNDDYVKFFRFAQLKMDAQHQGIIGVITNRWWIENVTFRGMRQSILDSFDQVYIFDLHGEADQGNDRNVFDITKGVAITVLVKKPGLERCVKYTDIWGSRLQKYRACAEAALSHVQWRDLNPTSPNYFLVPRTELNRGLYESFMSIKDIFNYGSTGILTGRDRLVVAHTEAALRENVECLLSAATDEEISRRFGLNPVEHWSLDHARKIIREEGLQPTYVRQIEYRPFETQFYYDNAALVFRRRETVMQHMQKGNVGISVCRLTKGGAWSHALISDHVVDDSFVSTNSKERAYLFPLRLSATEGNAIEITASNPENIQEPFRTYIGSSYEHHYTPEEILAYIYAVLYAPTYRSHYAEFLRIDFPRIPFPKAAHDFEALSGLGWALIQAHLLREYPRRWLAAYHGRGDHALEAVRYSLAEQAIIINKTQSFRPLPQGVWEFRIGGYQVLDKYLKSRKGRTLSLDEINHVGAVADSLAFTIDQMARIDEAYRSAFPDQN
jgi:predicted helicase